MQTNVFEWIKFTVQITDRIDAMRQNTCRKKLHTLFKINCGQVQMEFEESSKNTKPFKV